MRRVASTLCRVGFLGMLAGCVAEELPKTRIDRMQYVAIASEDPELEPGEPHTIRAAVADPLKPGEPLEFVVISCTTYSTSYYYVSGCLELIELADLQDLETGELTLDEDDYRTFFDRFVKRGSLESGGLTSELSAPLEVPSNFDYLFTEFDYTQVNASVYVLTCWQGLCPILDEIDAYQQGQPDAMGGEELLSIISQPDYLMSGLPIEGVAMGRKTYRVVANVGDDRNTNPEFVSLLPSEDCATALVSTDPEQRQCTFSATLEPSSLESFNPSTGSSGTTTEGVVVRFYSTAGTILPVSQQINPSSSMSVTATLFFDAPEETPERIGLYAVAVDSRGGMGYVAAELEP